MPGRARADTLSRTRTTRTTATPPPLRELRALRDRIDSVDDRIIDLIAERLRIAHEVAACKRRYGIAARLPDRIQAVLDRCALAGAAHDLDPRYVRELWAVIIEETCRIEEEILKRSPAASTKDGG